MRKIKTLVNLLVVALLLTGCSDDLMKEWNSQETGETKLVINAVFANASESRATLTENANGLSSSWQDGDKICVYSTSGTYLGELTRESGNTFSMTITNSNISNFAGKTLNLFYYGGHTHEWMQASPPTGLEPVSTLESLKGFDYAKSTVTVSSSITAGTYTGVSTATFTNILAFVKVFFQHNDAYYTYKEIRINPITGGIDEKGTYTYKFSSGVKYIPVVPGAVSLSYKANGNYYDIPTFTASPGKIYGGGTSATGLLPKGFVLDPTNRHDYVEIGGKKWAPCNLGAESPTDIGDYFQWASCDGGSKSYWEDQMEICIARNSPYYSTTKNDWTKYTRDDGKTRLELIDDAANYALGGNWHIPTRSEYIALFADCGGNGTTSCAVNTVTNPKSYTYLTQKGVYYCTNYQNGVSGILFYNGKNKLFFPSTGHFEDESWENVFYESTSPQAWTSEKEKPEWADPDALRMYGSTCDISSWTNRQWAIPIRAVTE